MKRSMYLVSAIGIFMQMAVPAFAEQTSVTMPSSLTPDALWKKIGDFCGIAEWHPIVKSCEISGSGRLRTLTVKGGDTLTDAVAQWDKGNGEAISGTGVAVDALEKWDDAGHCYGYTLVYGQAPITNYHSTLCVIAAPEGSAIKWSGKYRLKPGVTPAEAKKFLEEVYTTGAKALTETESK